MGAMWNSLRLYKMSFNVEEGDAPAKFWVREIRFISSVWRPGTPGAKILKRLWGGEADVRFKVCGMCPWGISKNGVVRKKGKKNLALFGTRHIRTTGWTREVKEGEDKKVHNELEEHKLLVTCSPHSQASDNGKAINAHKVWYGMHPFRWQKLVCPLMSHLVGHILLVSGQYSTGCCLSAVWLWAWNVLSNSLAKFYTSFSSDVEFSEKRIKKKILFGEYYQLCSKLVQGAWLLYSNLQWSTRGRVDWK